MLVSITPLSNQIYLTMRTILILMMLTMSLKAFSQECPCVKAAVIGKNAKAEVISNNEIIAMENVEIMSGESVDLQVLKSTGAISWYENGKKLSSNSVSPTETTEYQVKSLLEGCPDVFDKVIVNVNKTDDINNTISVFPNPTNDLLSVSAKEKAIKTLSVIDVNGKILLEKVYFGSRNTETINIASLKSGYYILSIRLSDNSVVSKKIIKT